MSIEEVLRNHEDAVMALPNVQAVGIGRKAGKDVIKVFVSSKVPESLLRPDQRIPVTLEGYEVDIEEIGTISAQSSAPSKEE